MSQAGLIDIEGSHPQIATQYDGDTGTGAVPIANILEIKGLTVANATYVKPISVSTSGNTVTINSQLSAALTGLPLTNAKAGICSFDDTAFTVDTNGYVQLLGGGEAIDSNSGDDGVEVSPDIAGNFNWNGLTVANATHAKAAYFKDATASNTIDLDIQVGAALTGAPLTNARAGICSFDDTMFSITSLGYVSLVASASFTTGSVIFWGASSFAEDNPNFFWDDTNNRLGLGITTPLDTFHVVGAMELDHTSVESDDHALELVVDSGSFADVKALDIDYITGNLAAGEESAVMLVNIDEALSTGGTIVGYDVTASSEGSAAIYGYATGINVNPILHKSGTFGDIDNILNKAVDVTAALASGGAGAISVFIADNDTVTYGDAAIWDEMEVIVTTPASGAGIAPSFEYSTGGAGFSAFIPIDGTNGLRNSGEISWESGDLAGWATNASGRFEVRQTRTRNSLSTTPILDEVQLSASTEFIWNKDGDVNLNSLTLLTPLVVSSGGTGLSTITDGGIMLGSGTGAVTPLGQATNGQLPIGSTSADPVLATLTAGTGVSITNGAGSITINASGGGFTWVDVTGTSDAIEANTGYISNNAGLVTLTLPVTCAVGDCHKVAGLGAGLWKVAQNASQLIHFGNMDTTTGVGGSLAASNRYDTLELLCVVTNTEWIVLNSVGVITVT